jgi:plastocyanin
MTLRAALLSFSAFAIACGGSSPTSPSDGGGGGGGGGGGPVQTTTITITSAGVSPRQIIVSAGARVTFINQDTRQHEMNSNPHPTHGHCPAIDDVGFIAAGQTKLTGNLTVVRTCGYHDHQNDTNTSLQGQIIVQ